jgi:Fur family ferric uptake transcriptional regulator
MIHWKRRDALSPVPRSPGVASSPAAIERADEGLMESQDLRRAGLKVTHPRMRILELLENAKSRHMTAEDIYRQLLEEGEEIGLATVYRVLTQFENAGLVLKHNFESGQSVYELDRGTHHDHMVDLETGKIIEFESPEIEELQRQVAAKYGYEIEEHSLVLYVRRKRG